MAVARLWRNVPHLKSLKKASPQTRKKILLTAPSDLINSLCDCCLNATKGNLKISKPARKKLLRHASTIRTLAKKTNSVKKRRQILVQKGGFLPTLLGSVLAYAVLNKWQNKWR